MLHCNADQEGNYEEQQSMRNEWYEEYEITDDDVNNNTANTHNNRHFRLRSFRYYILDWIQDVLWMVGL